MHFHDQVLDSWEVGDYSLTSLARLLEGKETVDKADLPAGIDSVEVWLETMTERLKVSDDEDVMETDVLAAITLNARRGKRDVVLMLLDEKLHLGLKSTDLPMALSAAAELLGWEEILPLVEEAFRLAAQDFLAGPILAAAKELAVAFPDLASLTELVTTEVLQNFTSAPPIELGSISASNLVQDFLDLYVELVQTKAEVRIEELVKGIMGNPKRFQVHDFLLPVLKVVMSSPQLTNLPRLDRLVDYTIKQSALLQVRRLSYVTAREVGEALTGYRLSVSPFPRPTSRRSLSSSAPPIEWACQLTSSRASSRLFEAKTL